MSKSSHKRTDGLSSSPLVAFAVAAVIVVAGLAIALVLTGSAGEGQPQAPSAVVPSDNGLPDYVLAAPSRVQQAYLFAAERPDVLTWMPCYCGCGDHSGHKSARNCFVQEGSSGDQILWDQHGAGCDMCVGIALDAKDMAADGASLREMRTYIDKTYGSIGPGTDTPLPPA